MALEVLILGSNSAIPTLQRNPSSQVVYASQRPYLIDCGEGTQLRLRTHGVKFQRIEQVFISHLHGDHYYGLPGLITSMHLLGRTRQLTIYSPPGLQDIIETNFKYSGTKLSYPLKFVKIEGESIIFEDKHIHVRTVGLKHRVPTYGFFFEEQPRLRTFLPEKGKEHGVPIELIPAIKEGEDFTKPDGTLVANGELTEDPVEPTSYAYCSDTAYLPDLSEKLKGVDLLYHEATFADDMEERAHETQHSTAREAARIAREAGVGKLLLGHFSTRYDELGDILAQAREEFEASELATEGTRWIAG